MKSNIRFCILQNIIPSIKCKLVMLMQDCVHSSEFLTLETEADRGKIL